MVRSGRTETPSSTSRRSTSARRTGGSWRPASRTSAGAAGSSPSSRTCASWIADEQVGRARQRPGALGEDALERAAHRHRAPPRAPRPRAATRVAHRPVSGSRSGTPSIPASARSSGGGERHRLAGGARPDADGDLVDEERPAVRRRRRRAPRSAAPGRRARRQSRSRTRARARPATKRASSARASARRSSPRSSTTGAGRRERRGVGAPASGRAAASPAGAARACADEPASPGRGGRGEHEEGGRREPRRERERGEERRDRGERARLGDELPADLAAERVALLLGGDARHRDPGGDREQERRDLRDEAVADREERVAPRGRRDVHPAERAGDEPAGDVDEDDGDARDRVPLHELERAVHRAVELALALEARAGAGAPRPRRWCPRGGPRRSPSAGRASRRG